MMILSTYCLSKYGVERAFRIAKKAGYEGLDMQVTDNLDTQDFNYLDELIKEYKLPVSVFSLPASASRKLISKIIELAEKLETKYVVIYPPKLMDFSGIKWIQRMIPLSFKEHKVNLCVINVPSSSILGFLPEYSYSSLLELRKLQNVAMDVTNLVSKREDLMRALDLLGKSLRHVYISNVHQGRDHYVPQEGILPIESFLNKLADIDYKGFISVKVGGQYISDEDMEVLTLELSKIREYIVKYYS